MNVVETHNLTRMFGATYAVDRLEFAVPEGSILALLGENGSGKTTTIRLIMGMLVPMHGDVRVFGRNPLEMPPALRARIGYIADEMGLPDTMRLQDAMELHSSYFPAWDHALANRLLKEFELGPHFRYGILSKGQKRRFLLTLVAAQRPDFFVLDEPAGGLDVGVRRQFIDLLLELAAEKTMTILISSHMLTDVERIIDRVAFIKAGRLVKQGALEEMKASTKRLCVAPGTQSARARFHVIKEDHDQGMLRLVVDDFEEEKLAGLDCVVEHLNLEELFLLYNVRTARAKA